MVLICCGDGRSVVVMVVLICGDGRSVLICGVDCCEKYLIEMLLVILFKDEGIIVF